MKSLRTIIVLITFISSGYSAFSQIARASNAIPISSEAIEIKNEYNTVFPSFAGGHEALQSFMQENLEYPITAIRKGHEGTVVVEFFVNTDGIIENISIRKSVCDQLDEAAIDLVKKMPRWNPARDNGELVRARYLLPITFELTL